MHVPVLLQEILQILTPRSGGVYLDGTLGAGGYAEAILEESSPDGRVIGLDLDPDAVERATRRLDRFGNRFRPVHGGFQDAREILMSMAISRVDAAVLDLGLSSDQLEDPARGFSFRSTGPLDMRFDTSSGQKVAEYLQNISIKKLEEILAAYGEERYCKKLARGIIRERDRGSIATTEDLAQAVTGILGGRRGKIHPATRTFQALRIAVNRELENLEAALRDIPDLLAAGGRLCVVSYHSLEDRAVKNSFRERKRESGRWNIVFPKPVRPSPEETRSNPRARSARLRVLEALC
ncbi:MAG TPA: 16S rRNA (cytosine(1402)-N(4))-methyltransferase RsmH [Desulfomonilaceae bacterium]|nr:16S rRNA (cytosine(1402)-N(4))-methyltransferase RsmH [Desulfomonilaceae bacterium]